MSVLRQEGGHELRLLYHSATGQNVGETANEYVTRGDLLTTASLNGWLEPRCTVIHLAYMWGEGVERNLDATRNLCDVCKVAKVRRLVHISTADVVGRASGDLITEGIICKPRSDYARTKLLIEATLRDAAATAGFDLVILRPTSVYGPTGVALSTLLRDLRGGYWVKNCFRTLLFGDRAMNLIHVDVVVAALRFLVAYPGDFNGEILLLSEDADEANNFSYVVQAILDTLELKPFPIHSWHLPDAVLSTLLRLRGRDSINPRRRFSSSRIESLGFRKPRGFVEGLHDYLAWYRNTVHVKRQVDGANLL